MSPKDFVARWGTAVPLLRFRKKALEGLSVSDNDKEFLAKAGLPQSAAPELSFEIPKSGELPTVADQWDQPKKFQRYRVIGSDGSGNPIAIDENRKGEVVCLAHDEKFARTLVNKTLGQLAESLLAYRDLVRDLVAVDGEDALANGELPPKLRDQLHQTLTKIDPAALKPGCFWSNETKTSDADADYPASVLRDLQAPDTKVRLKASKHLESELRNGFSEQRKERFGNERVTRPLIAALDDPNPKVVHNAVVALAQIGKHYFKDDRAYDKLLQLVHSKHPLTTRWAIDGVINLREEASLDDVLPLCMDESQEARAMVFLDLQSWLMLMRTQRSECIRIENQARLREAALQGLSDTDTNVRANAASLLREVGSSADIAVLQKVGDEESYWLTKKVIDDTVKHLEGQ